MLGCSYNDFCQSYNTTLCDFYYSDKKLFHVQINETNKRCKICRIKRPIRYLRSKFFQIQSNFLFKKIFFLKKIAFDVDGTTSNMNMPYKDRSRLKNYFRNQTQLMD